MSYRQNKSLRKAFAILECVNQARNGRSATEVAYSTAIPSATAHRLLTELVSLGYLQFDQTSKLYSIGFNLTLFGNRRLVIDRIAHRARPVLRSLSANTRLTAYIGSLEGTQAIVEDRAVYAQNGKIAHNVGTHLDGHAHSLGKALLAVRSRREIMAAFEIVGLRHYTRNTIRSKDALLANLRDTLANGYAIDNEEMNAGVRSVAIALVNPKGRAMCSIALEGPKHRISERSFAKLAEILREAGVQIMRGIR